MFLLLFSFSSIHHLVVLQEREIKEEGNESSLVQEILTKSTNQPAWFNVFLIMEAVVHLPISAWVMVPLWQGKGACFSQRSINVIFALPL